MKNSYEIRGSETAIKVKCKGIELETLIDTEDLPKADEVNTTWYAIWCKRTNSYYVITSYKIEGKRRTVQLHRWITGTEDGLFVDHINHETLDNRRSCNLREVTNSQNIQNLKGSRKGAKSSHRGVIWSNRLNCWFARVRVDGKTVFQRRYHDEEVAAAAAAKARADYMPFSQEARKVSV